jgi:phage terminase large subunit GpA-like protein
MAARVRPLRSLREWTEAEVVIPDGPFKGERFRIRRQPFCGLLFDEIDSGRWPEVFVVGPSQTGKTLIGHVIPTIYSAAELRRNVVLAPPDMRMAGNKWEIDFRPVLEASPSLAALIPSTGPGSRGGAIKDAVRLTNGAVIKWMTAGGDDTQRAGFTAEGGVYVTEAARFSSSGESSVEADPLDQLRARMQAMPRRRRRLVVEGTATVEAELPWAAREQSSQSQISLPCPHCAAWVSLEREHLVGWQEAKSEWEAADKSHYCCPACAAPWTEEERAAANLTGKLLHRGQSIDVHGEITGDRPPTERLWFRWTMGNNLLLTAGDVAIDEWKAAQLTADSDARENAERKLCQFVWARPFVSALLGDEPLTSHRISKRQDQLPRGMCPPDTKWITVGVDIGKYMGHFVVIAWRENGQATVIDYGVFDVPSKRNKDDDTGFDVLIAVGKSLDTLRERFESIGWVRHGSGEVMLADKVLIDTGAWPEPIQAFARRWSADGNFGRASETYVCCRGAGAGQHAARKYQHPTRKGATVVMLGDRYHVAKQPTARVHVVELDADHWKSWVHERLQTPIGQPGSLALFAAAEKEHNTYTKHLSNEHATQKPIAGRGLVTVWENESKKPNHYFDATSYACVAGHMVGFRVLDPVLVTQPSEAELRAAVEIYAAQASLPDGRNFHDTSRPGDP